MPSYKLTYFDARGLDEPARQLFHLGGIKFEDKRVSHEEFAKLKSKTPFGMLPVLSVDGFEIPESAAIGRYLAKKFGKSPEEEAWVNAIVDQFKDYMTSFRTLAQARFAKKSVDEIEKINKEIFTPAIENYFKIINGILEKSKSGFLVGEKLTWADLVVVDNLVTLEKLGFFSAKKQPKLAALKKKVHSVPKLKEYIANRPDTEF